MLKTLIITWLVYALALWIMGRVIPGIQVDGFGAAILGAAVLAIVDSTLGPILRFLALPITFLTLGLFGWVVRAAVLKLAAMFSPGFRIRGFVPALLGALVLTLLVWVLERVVL